MDIYKGLRVICVLNCLVTSEAAEGYLALGIITRHQYQNYHMRLILHPTNKIMETAKIYAESHESTSEKKNPYLSIYNFQKFKIVTIPNLLSTNIWLLLITKEDLIQNRPYWFTLIRTNFWTESYTYMKIFDQYNTFLKRFDSYSTKYLLCNTSFRIIN